MGGEMAKYNPATKAAERAKDPNGGKEEESSESGTVSQMLENYEEYETHRSRPQTDVLERLPDKAEMENGKLWVRDPRADMDFDRERMSLTKSKRKVLLAKLENPHESNVELAEKTDCSNATISRTIRGFRFLLDDPYLIDGFVYSGQVPSDYFVVRNGDEEFAFPLEEQAVEVGAELWGDDFTVISPEDGVLVQNESEDEPNLPSEEEEAIVSPQTANGSEVSPQLESVSLSVTLEEFQSVVNGVDDELQMKLLRQLYEQ